MEKTYTEFLLNENYYPPNSFIGTLILSNNGKTYTFIPDDKSYETYSIPFDFLYMKDGWFENNIPPKGKKIRGALHLEVGSFSVKWLPISDIVEFINDIPHQNRSKALVFWPDHAW